jgi:hypothetical protein
MCPGSLGVEPHYLHAESMSLGTEDPRTRTGAQRGNLAKISVSILLSGVIKALSVLFTKQILEY